MDKEQLLLNTFFAFLSALMGVILGVLYNNRRLRLFRVSETQELRRKLIKAFRFNIDRLKQMSGQLASQPPTIPDFRLDTESVAHILFHGRDLFANEQWFDRFGWQWYQLGAIRFYV